MSTQKLELQAKQAQLVDPEDEVTEDDALRTDLFDCISLLARCQRLLAYSADTKLHRILSKRERIAMAKLGGEIKALLDEVENIYD